MKPFYMFLVENSSPLFITIVWLEFMNEIFRFLKFQIPEYLKI